MHIKQNTMQELKGLNYVNTAIRSQKHSSEKEPVVECNHLLHTKQHYIFPI